MATWLTSDLHFQHVNILKYCRPEFTDLDHMREIFVVNWNNSIQPEDEVYVLGDVVMGNREENLTVFNRLNGHKILIAGNHDNCHSSNSKARVERFTPIYEQYFQAITEELEIFVGDNKALLCHFPAAGDHTDEVRYREFRPTNYDGFIIHGHLHCTDISVAPKHVHIGIDSDWTEHGVPRYSPIPLRAIEQVIESW